MGTEDVGDDPWNRDELQRRARRRVVWTMVAIAIMVPIGNLILSSTVLRAEHPHARHASLLQVVVVAVMSMAVGFATVALLLRRGKRNPDSIYAASPAAGLPRRQRRSVLRNIRRATPSADPDQARIEREVAAKVVHATPRSGWMLALFLVLDIVLSIVSHSLAARLFFAAAAVLFVAGALLSLIQYRGARAYLARTHPYAASPHP